MAEHQFNLVEPQPPTQGQIITFNGGVWTIGDLPVVPAGLEDLTDVTITGPQAGHILVYGGSFWLNATLAAAGIASTSHAATHAIGGGDALTLDESQITDLEGDLATLSSDVASAASLGGGALNAAASAQAAIDAHEMATGTAVHGLGSASTYSAASTNTVSTVVLRDASGNFAASVITADHGLNFSTVTPPVAPGLALVTDGTGLVNAGIHIYEVTYTTATGETPATTYASITTDASHTKVTITLPVSTDPRVTGRKIFRTTAAYGNAGYYWLAGYIATIANNTQTTYTDDLPDSSVVATYAWSFRNTTNSLITLNSTPSLVLDPNGTLVGTGAGGAGGGICIGFNAGHNQLAGISNYYFGALVGGNTTWGIGNIAIGQAVAYAITTGSSNIAIGAYDTLRYCVSGDYNIALGYSTLRATTGANNTGVGSWALATTTGSNSVGLGFYAGNYETGSLKLFIDALDRGSEANGRSMSLIYGVMNANPANQTLTINGKLTTTVGLNTPTGTPASAGAAGTAGDIVWDANFLYVCTALNTWKRSALSSW